MKVSVIVPAYNEEIMISQTALAIKKALCEVPHQIIFVDDGSTDKTWENICNIKSDNIKGVKLSRNFGKEGAILAGFSVACGDCCVVMDCDLQHPTHILKRMYDIWINGNVDIVEGIKKTRGRESVASKILAFVFYRTLAILGDLPIKNSSDFKLLDRKVVKILLEMPEYSRFFRGMTSWLGFRRVQIEFDVEPRMAGKTKFTTKGLVKYAMNNIISFSTKPLQFVVFSGFCFFILTIVLGVQTVHTWLLGNAIGGFTTVILLLLFIGSIIMFSLGIIGVYVAKIYEEVKARPKFIIETQV